MAVKIITKKKIAAKSKEVVAPVDMAAQLITEMDKYQKLMVPILAKLKPMQNSFDIAKSELQTLCDELYEDENKGHMQFGNISCDISAKAKSTIITDKERAIEILQNLGDDVILELVKFGITDLRAYLTPMELKEVTKTERTGKRTIKLSEVSER